MYIPALYLTNERRSERDYKGALKGRCEFATSTKMCGGGGATIAVTVLHIFLKLRVALMAVLHYYLLKLILCLVFII